MKKQLFFTIALFWCSLVSFGQDFNYNGINYAVTSTVSPLTVIVSPNSSFIGDANIPATVTYNAISYSVTSIGNNSFQNCTGLTSVTIPNSVTSIGTFAFASCSNLTSATIPNSVTIIGVSAFNGCSKLASVTIPNSVTGLGQQAFQNCTGLTSVTISNSVTSIRSNTFRGCTGLTSITIPNSVTNLEISSFYGCTSLASVTIPNSVTNIGNTTFYNCTGLTSITIPNSVTTIGGNVFQYCISLTSVTIPNSVTSLGNAAFFGCSGLTSLTIPNSVTSIGSSAFQNCSGLTSVTIPNSLTSIGISTFSGCTELTSFTIPSTVTSIGNAAFGNCIGLTSLSIPNSVTIIGSNSFQNCIGLTDVTVNWATPLSNININSFQGVTLANVKLYVPAGTQTAYASSIVWSNFNIILPLIATQSQTDVSCNGGSNGLASVVVSGGTMPYTYLWSNGSNSATATGLTTGNYSCTITDATMISVIKNFVITEPTQLTATQSQTNVSCFGGGNGTATVTPSGGTMPYTYFWTPNGSVSATATGLIAGDYFCIITDNNGCNISKSFTITEPTAISVDASTQTNVSCYLGSNGLATVVPSGGTAPYTYDWGLGFATQNTRSGLSRGNYSVIVKDAKGCTKIKSFLITQPTELTTAGSQNNVPCSGATIDTFATVTTSGGTAPYTYFWNNGATTQSISEIAAGNYFVTVTDYNGCSVAQNFTITSSVTPLPTRNTINGTLCEPSTYADLASKFDNLNTIKIYETATSTTPLNPQDIIAPIGTNVTYYITQTLNGCESARLAYSAFVNTLPTPTAFDQNFCGSGFEVGNLVATLSQNASSLKWYDVPTGGNALSSTVPLVSGNYYVTQNKYPCGESARKMITVTVSYPTDNVSTISTCDSYTWNSTTYNQTGIYVGTTTNCITEKLDLTITPSYYNNTTRSACDSYTWANNNQTYTQSGTYYGTTTGCGTEKLNLTITPTPIADAPANVSNCFSYTLPALSPGNKYYSEANGQGIEYVVGANDGITQTSEIYVLARSPFFPFCQTQNSFTVTIIPNTGTATTTNACGSYIWGVNGETYSTSGNYEYVSGCNTSYLNLTINPAITNLTTKTECNSYFWPDNGTTYNETGTYSFNVGCETFILNLTITPSSDNITTATACDSFTWNGQTYNQTGIYVGTTTNCVTEKLNLTITPSSINTTTATAVGFYNWTVTGGDYTATGLYNGTITNCVRQKLDLTILPVTISVTQNNVVLTANTNATNVTYEWFVCATPNNILIPNETNSTFTPTASGSYFCRIKIGGNSEAAYRIASDCFNFTFLANNTFSEIAGLDIYPNPSTGIFNLKLPTDLQIEVYNNLGQLLSSEKMLSGSNVINIADKPVGIYFLKANDGNNVSTFKIIKN